MALNTVTCPSLLCHVSHHHVTSLAAVPCPLLPCQIPRYCTMSPSTVPPPWPPCSPGALSPLCPAVFTLLPRARPQGCGKRKCGKRGFPPHSTPFLLLLIPLIFHFFSLAATTHPGCLERSWHRGVPHGDPQIPGSLELHSPQLEGEQSSRWQRGLRLLPADIQPRFPQH